MNLTGAERPKTSLPKSARKSFKIMPLQCPSPPLHTKPFVVTPEKTPLSPTRHGPIAATFFQSLSKQQQIHESSSPPRIKNPFTAKTTPVFGSNTDVIHQTNLKTMNRIPGIKGSTKDIFLCFHFWN